MSTDPQVVAELRQLFREGATPSRLIRHIATRHDDSAWPRMVGEYFAAAFAVCTLVADGWPGGVELDALDLSALDHELLRDMVGRSRLWESSEDADTPPAWWDGLRVSASEPELVGRIRPETHPALNGVWESLPDRVRSHLRQSMVNAQAYHEYTTTLTRLVEHLQEQVVRLERQRELSAVGV